MSPFRNVFSQQSMGSFLVANPLLDAGRKSVFATLSVGFSHVRETRHVAYGKAPKQRMDLYFPAGRSPQATIAFVHGGSWRTGDKDEYRFVGRALAQRGFAVAVIGYRLYPEVHFPGFVHDVAQACIYLQQNNARLGWPALPLWLCGHSAGAHIAMLVAMEPAFSAAFGASMSPVAGVIGMSGAYSFRPERDRLLLPVFGQRGHAQWHVPMCPIECVGKHQPPLLLIHGSKDATVSVKVAQRMYDKARAEGQSVRFERLEGQGHYQPVFSFHPAVAGHRRLMDSIEDFCIGHGLGKNA